MCMHDKWPFIYDFILSNCNCFVTVYEGLCGQYGLVLGSCITHVLGWPFISKQQVKPLNELLVGKTQSCK